MKNELEFLKDKAPKDAPLPAAEKKRPKDDPNEKQHEHK